MLGTVNQLPIQIPQDHSRPRSLLLLTKPLFGCTVGRLITVNRAWCVPSFLHSLHLFIPRQVFAVNPGDKFSAFQAAANGTANVSSVSSASASSTAATTTAAVVVNTAAPTIVTVTATVTASGETITTTYGSYPGSAAPTSGSSVSHLVTVGNGGTLTFTPSEISAQPGDTVTFQFMAKNHTATQSSFKDPCRSLTSTSTTGQVGFDSGL